MLEYDVVVKMPPKNQIFIRVKVKSIQKAIPKILKINDR